jgi:acetoacetyl-CoA synthetase
MKNQRLWQPSPERIARSRMVDFHRWLAERGHAVGERPDDYAALYYWSIEHYAEFWSNLWDYLNVVGEKGSRVIDNPDDFVGYRFFPEGKLNFAENILRRRDDGIALISRLENGHRETITWRTLYSRVATTAAALREKGIQSGDVIAAFMPNISETVVCMLAAASLGAIWTSCSPDFGINGVVDRFGQTKPRLLLACDGYFYNGKTIDSLPLVRQIVDAIDSIETCWVVAVVNRQVPQAVDIASIRHAERFDQVLNNTPCDTIDFLRLPFNHPLYILYSSGTTGVPKCIVHGAGGTLLQHMKEHALHTGLRHDQRYFYFTTCGWTMWNILVSALLCEATIILYDGSPFYPKKDALIDMIDQEQIAVFGTSARYLSALQKADIRPRQSHQLSSLQTILSTGSVLTHESFDYVYRDIKEDVCLSSISGGTDIISAFISGSETLPVYRGELQCPGLGMAVEFWDDDGRPLRDAKGELVCVKPFISKPLGFWNDPDNEKFHEAYFARFPGVWAHGDYGEYVTHSEGSRDLGGVIIHGRSDAVLNPGGVRIGTAEIYRQVEKVHEVQESVCISQEWEGDVRVILFVVMRPGYTLDERIQSKIRETIRLETTSRHVPAKILEVNDIPRTLSGKIAELAVRNVVHGRPVKNVDALANPQALEQFRDRPELKS